jgi:hypothetical protein
MAESTSFPTICAQPHFQWLAKIKIPGSQAASKKKD